MKFIIRNLSAVCLLVITGLVSAETQTYIRSYTYQASETDSKLSARKAALSQVEQLLLGELGTLVKSRIDISQNSQGKNLSQHDITALTGGVVKTEILNEKWNGYQYIVKARLKADPEEIAKKLMQANLASVPQTNTNVVSSEKLLLKKPGKVILVSRHEVGEESELDDDALTKLLSETVKKVVNKKLPEGSKMSMLIDLDKTGDFVYEDFEAKNSKKQCKKDNADMIVSTVLDDIGSLRFGWKREMILTIYDCHKAVMLHHKFVPDPSNEGSYPREVSVRRELRKHINEYIDAL